MLLRLWRVLTPEHFYTPLKHTNITELILKKDMLNQKLIF